jgi:hemolysin activation/secretion protein
MLADARIAARSRSVLPRWLAACLAASVIAPAMPALAQLSPTPFPGQPEPGRNVPPPGPPSPPEFEFNIPSPRRGPVPRAVDSITFDVTNIKVVGATVFPPEAFEPFIKPLVGAQAKLSDIIGVADKIEAMYREHGYVLTRAFLPPQTVTSGVFQINVGEGFVKAGSVTGGDEASRQRVESYIAPVTTERPTKIDTMERGLLLANDLPGTSASGVLRPSPTDPGASDLIVALNQIPYQATLYSDNRGSTSSGVFTVGGQFVANDVPKIGGQFTFDASAAPFFQQRNLFQTHYSRAVGSAGEVLSVFGVWSHGAPVGPSAAGGLVSNSYSFGTRLSYPYIVSRPFRLSFEGGLTVQSEKVTLGAAACDIDDDHWHTVDGAVTTQTTGLIHDSTTGFTLGLMQGIPGFGTDSTMPCAGTSGKPTDFMKVTATATHDQPIAGPVSANFRLISQYAPDKLFVGEQTSFGGSGIGRGYDPAALAADSGVGLASELRYNLQFPQYHVDFAQFYGFFDVARTWANHDGPVIAEVDVPNRQSLASTGFGLRVSLLQTVTGGIEFAQQLKGVPNNDGSTRSGKTDSRLLFNLAIRY